MFLIAAARICAHSLWSACRTVFFLIWQLDAVTTVLIRGIEEVQAKAQLRPMFDPGERHTLQARLKGYSMTLELLIAFAKSPAPAHEWLSLAIMRLAHRAVAAMKKGLRNPEDSSIGCLLRAFAAFTYSERTYERVFKQHLADIDYDYHQAEAAGDKWGARLVHVRGVVTFWRVVALHSYHALITIAVKRLRTS
jgi:hypothetical protein